MSAFEDAPETLPDALLRADLTDAVRTAAHVHALYLDIVEELVRSYVTRLRERGAGRAASQRILSELVVSATGEAHSALLLYVARWVDAMFPGDDPEGSYVRRRG